MISLLVLCCTLLAKAQNDVAIATLQHGDNVSVFKGPSALASALAAADEEGGDVITLSQGTFTAAAITKPVSIYGAGFETDNASSTLLTTISGDLTVGRTDITRCQNQIEINARSEFQFKHQFRPVCFYGYDESWE